jgi:retron-type reverse transcriptase
MQKWWKAGVVEDGQWNQTEEGSPQGTVISAILANLYLPYVLDLWVKAWRKKQARGEVIVVRCADDRVLGASNAKARNATWGRCGSDCGNSGGSYTRRRNA